LANQKCRKKLIGTLVAIGIASAIAAPAILAQILKIISKS
jgi:hypothetical protein